MNESESSRRLTDPEDEDLEEDLDFRDDFREFTIGEDSARGRSSSSSFLSILRPILVFFAILNKRYAGFREEKRLFFFLLHECV